eukprot:GHVR01000025.1.p1 GENE.GHVR01000025.1~~GHVR01000025.1.p1  ORF type:complete len:108 (-),score=0.98 GHVR01000025.1:1522-1845(-)
MIKPLSPNQYNFHLISSPTNKQIISQRRDYGIKNSQNRPLTPQTPVHNDKKQLIDQIISKCKRIDSPASNSQLNSHYSSNNKTYYENGCSSQINIPNESNFQNRSIN